MDIDQIEVDILKSKEYPMDDFPIPCGRYTFYTECMEYVKDRNGLFLEFGVYQGGTINFLSSILENKVFYGFDSFEGLPEAWDGGDHAIHPAGWFKTEIPNVNQNVNLIPGWYDQTLDGFLKDHKSKISFLHLDCDIYSSHDYVFKRIENCLEDNCLIIFDDFLNFPNYKNHSIKAFSEFLQRTNFSYEPFGHIKEDYSRCAFIIKK